MCIRCGRNVFALKHVYAIRLMALRKVQRRCYSPLHIPGPSCPTALLSSHLSQIPTAHTICISDGSLQSGEGGLSEKVVGKVGWEVVGHEVDLVNVFEWVLPLLGLLLLLVP